MGMRVVRDDLWLCVDCLMLAVNGDASGIEDEERVKACEAGINELGPHLVIDSDADTDEGHQSFSWSMCDCCKSTLGGERHRFAILGPETIDHIRDDVTEMWTERRASPTDIADDIARLLGRPVPDPSAEDLLAHLDESSLRLLRRRLVEEEQTAERARMSLRDPETSLERLIGLGILPGKPN